MEYALNQAFTPLNKRQMSLDDLGLFSAAIWGQ